VRKIRFNEDPSGSKARTGGMLLGARTYSYSSSRRALEVGALIFAAFLTLATAVAVHHALPSGGVAVALLFCFAGLCVADFASGLVHWAADTYGTPTMPVFGGFVRTFREHHADKLAITRHDAIETNGDVAIFSSPVHAALLLFVENPLGLSLMLGVFVGSYTNSQIHQWAHREHPPELVRFLQRLRILLTATHHEQHHSGPHLTHYCITTGWMNPLLDRTRFFRGLEWALARAGIKPNRRS
jgi:hypothetical protein